MHGAERCQHRGRCQTTTETDRDQGFLGGTESAAACFFTGADAEHAGLIEMCPGIGGFVIGCMQACERQQFGKRVVHRVRKRQLVGARVIAGVFLHSGSASPVMIVSVYSTLLAALLINTVVDILSSQKTAAIRLRRLDAKHRRDDTRSDEHTSELPSLMRNQYAVLLLKTKNKN